MCSPRTLACKPGKAKTLADVQAAAVTADLSCITDALRKHRLLSQRTQHD